MKEKQSLPEFVKTNYSNDKTLEILLRKFVRENPRGLPDKNQECKKVVEEGIDKYFTLKQTEGYTVSVEGLDKNFIDWVVENADLGSLREIITNYLYSIRIERSLPEGDNECKSVLKKGMDIYFSLSEQPNWCIQ